MSGGGAERETYCRLCTRDQLTRELVRVLCEKLMPVLRLSRFVVHQTAA